MFLQCNAPYYINTLFACFYKVSNVRYMNLYWTFQCWLSWSHNMALLFKQRNSCLWFEPRGQTTIPCWGPAFKTQYMLFFSAGMKLKEHLIKGWHISSAAFYPNDQVFLRRNIFRRLLCQARWEQLHYEERRSYVLVLCLGFRSLRFLLQMLLMNLLSDRSIAHLKELLLLAFDS